DVSGTSFSPTTSTIMGGDHKLYAAVPTSCGYSYDCKGQTNVNDIGHALDWQLFPNPASDQVTLVLPEAALGADYQLTDLARRLITSGRISDTRTVLDVRSLASGAYHLRISTGGLHRTIKLMK